MLKFYKFWKTSWNLFEYGFKTLFEMILTVVIDVFLFTKVIIFLDDEISQIIIQFGVNF